MEENTFNKKNLIAYFGFSYLLFWILFGLIGATIYLLDAPPAVVGGIKTFSAWSPTIVLLIMYKKLMPDLPIKDFLKREFQTPVGKKPFLIILLMVGIIATGIGLAYLGTSTLIVRDMTLAMVGSLFISTLLAGATGEELGWRGYAYNELRKKFNFTKTALLLGLVWGFWHTPLWFISGYAGADLIKFIIAYLLGILSHSVIISFFYERTHNVILPMLVHFLYNFLSEFLEFDISAAAYWWIPYVVVAVTLIFIQSRKEKAT